MVKTIRLLMLVMLLFAGPVLADDIVHFKSGSALPIRGYEVVDDMLKVDLGNDGEMSFPLNVVDRIEGADGSVVRPDVQLNRMLESPSGSDPNRRATVTGGSVRPKSRERQQQLENESIQTRNAVAATPRAGSPQKRTSRSVPKHLQNSIREHRGAITKQTRAPSEQSEYANRRPAQVGKIINKKQNPDDGGGGGE